MSKVLLLYNAPVLASDHPESEAEQDLILTVAAVRLALAGKGHHVQELGLGRSPQPLLEALEKTPFDVVFNLFEGLSNQTETEYYVAGLLEWIGIPYTGCPVEAMVLGRDKVCAKHLLRGAGLPTADFMVVGQDLQEEKLPPWPVIVKPAGTDASIGIAQSSVVTNRTALKRKIEALLSQYGSPVMVEAYLPGTEFNVGVVECPDLRALPVAELVYTPLPGAPWPIVTYESKWSPGSEEDLAMLPRCPAMIDENRRGDLQKLALAVFQLFGCRDYARVDIRLDVQGHHQVLEINPNPDLGPTAGLARMLQVEGWKYDDFIEQLVKQNLK